MMTADTRFHKLLPFASLRSPKPKLELLRSFTKKSEEANLKSQNCMDKKEDGNYSRGGWL